MATQVAGESPATAVSIDGIDLYLERSVVPLCEHASSLAEWQAEEHPLTAFLRFSVDQSGVGAHLRFSGRSIQSGEDVQTGWAPCCIPRRIDSEQAIALLGDEPSFEAKHIVPVALGIWQPQALREQVVGALHDRMLDLTVGVTCDWDDARTTLVVTVDIGPPEDPALLALTFRFPRACVKETFEVNGAPD